MASYRGEFAVNNPAFPAGSAAAIPTHAGDDLRPVAMDAPDIVYTSEDDRAIDEYLRAQSECLSITLVHYIQALIIGAV